MATTFSLRLPVASSRPVALLPTAPSSKGVLQLAVPLDRVFLLLQTHLAEHAANGSLGIVRPEEANVFRLRIVVAHAVAILRAHRLAVAEWGLPADQSVAEVDLADEGALGGEDLGADLAG